MIREVTFFHPPKRPNGGTVNARPVGSGNPYANFEEQEVPVVVVGLPEYEEPAVAAATEKGHTIEWDPPAALTAARRWTCRRCGNAVLDYQGNVYGGALQITCDESIARWEAMGR